MLDILFDKFIKGPLYSKIYTETWEDIADGGPTCYKELSVSYRATVAVIMVTYCTVFVREISRPFFNFVC